MREIVTIGWDGRSKPIRRYADELHLPDTARSTVHKPLHDPWMTDPSDPDYLEPRRRWCIICTKLDSEH